MPKASICTYASGKALTVRMVMVFALLSLRASCILLGADAVVSTSRVAITDQSDFAGVDFVRTRTSWLDAAQPRLSHFATATAPRVRVSVPRFIAVLDRFEATVTPAIAERKLLGRAPPV